MVAISLPKVALPHCPLLLASREGTKKTPRPNWSEAFLFRFESLDLLSVNGNSTLVLRAFELNLAVDQRINCVISTDADVWTRVELGSSLSNDDGAWLDDFATVLLNSQSLRITVATVSC